MLLAALIQKFLTTEEILTSMCCSIGKATLFTPIFALVLIMLLINKSQFISFWRMKTSITINALASLRPSFSYTGWTNIMILRITVMYKIFLLSMLALCSRVITLFMHYRKISRAICCKFASNLCLIMLADRVENDFRAPSIANLIMNTRNLAWLTWRVYQRCFVDLLQSLLPWVVIWWYLALKSSCVLSILNTSSRSSCCCQSSIS